MKFSKLLGALVVAALLSAALANTASATTAEIKGVKQTGATTIKASLKASTSLLMVETVGGFVNTCIASIPSTIELKVEGSATGSTVGGGLVFSPGFCSEQPIVTDAGGSFTIENSTGTTDGTLRSTGTQMTYPSPYGPLTCTTSNTDLGRLTGVASGNATLDINAVINCGFFAPSVKWTATYTVTSPEGLGFTA
jgi:hypothetical protein